MTAFVFGYLLGSVTPLAAAGLMLWWLARRAKTGVIAKLLQGLAIILNDKPKAPVAPVNGAERKERAV